MFMYEYSRAKFVELQCERDKLKGQVDRLEESVRKLKDELHAKETGLRFGGNHCAGCKHMFVLRTYYANGTFIYDNACALDKKKFCADYTPMEG